MESWRRVWREGIAPLLSTAALVALRNALATNDPRLVQGETVVPFLPDCFLERNWPVDSACALSFCGWQGDGLKTVGEVEEFFGHICSDIDYAIQEAAGCRHFLHWFDDTPRDEMRKQLLPEVDLALATSEAAKQRESEESQAMADLQEPALATV